MIMSWIFIGILSVSVFCAMLTGKGPELASAIPRGAQAGLTLAMSMGGSICLWTGVGRLMEASGITAALSRLLSPLLAILFPGTRANPELSHHLSGNICANFLGLGNAATPMGIRAAICMADKSKTASDELCRLIVLNTASIQLIPANVAAVRASLGCMTPFDILPAVWLTSMCSAGLGVGAAWVLGRVWSHD